MSLAAPLVALHLDASKGQDNGLHCDDGPVARAGLRHADVEGTPRAGRAAKWVLLLAIPRAAEGAAEQTGAIRVVFRNGDDRAAQES